MLCLDGKYARMLRHPGGGPLLMRGSDTLWRYVIVIEKAIAGLGISPVLTRLVNRQARLHRQLHRQCAAPGIQTSIAQLDVGKLVDAPLVFE